MKLFGPPRYNEKQRAAVLEHIVKNFGTPSRLIGEMPLEKVRLTFAIIEPSKDRDYYVVVTIGMGARKMKVPKPLRQMSLERAELVFTLPPYWNVLSDDERWRWPLLLTAIIANFPFRSRDWLGPGHTIGSMDAETFTSNTMLNSVILAFPEAFGQSATLCTLPDGDSVEFLQIVPLYGEELEFKLKYGAHAIMARLGELAHVIDPVRPNAMTDERCIDRDDIMDEMKTHAEKISEKGLAVDGLCACNHMAAFLSFAILNGLTDAAFDMKYKETVAAVRGGRKNDLRTFIRDELAGQLRLSYFDAETREFARDYYHYTYMCDECYPADIDKFADEYFKNTADIGQMQDEEYLFIPFDGEYLKKTATMIGEALCKFRTDGY